MKNFYFKRSNGEEILILGDCDEQSAMVRMHDFMHEYNFKSYYTRMWEEDNVKYYDVGSHTEFFILKEEKGQ